MNFEFGKRSTEELKDEIWEAAKEIKKAEYTKITIAGHTDSVGKYDLNKRLSQERAESARIEFVEAGIPPEKISSAGFAWDVPVQSNETREGRAANRRTEIHIHRIYKVVQI